MSKSIDRVCQVEDCNRALFSLGYCKTHWRRYQKHGDPLPHIPIKDYSQPRLCSVVGCQGKHVGRGFCNTHLNRYWRHGDPQADKPVQQKVNQGFTYSDGYRLVKDPATGKRRPEHCLIMESALGRSLQKHEEVHHKNGVRDDNRLQNLELWTTSQPAGSRVCDKVQWAKEILEQYEPDALA